MQDDTDNLEQNAKNKSIKNLVLLCVAAVFIGHVLSKSDSTNIGYVLGYSLPIAAIVWVLFRASIGATESRRFGVISFFSLWIAMAAGAGISGLYNHWQAEQALHDIVSEFDRIKEESVDTTGQPNLIKPVETTPTVSGEFGKMEHLIRKYMNEMVTLQNSYLHELNGAGWDRILDPERVKDPERLSESEMIIKRAREISNKYKTEHIELLQEIPQRIDDLEVSAVNREAMLEGFSKSMQKTRTRLDALWGLELRVIDEFKSIVTLLSETRGHWGFEEGQFVFEYDRDLEKFNEHVAAVNEIVTKQEAIRQKAREDMVKTVNEFSESR